ncbi:unnamed protein product, partial [Leptidea sinapis]
IVWYMNNTQQDINFQVVYGEGNYTCVVSNVFGVITRTYIVTPNLNACKLNVQTDFKETQPLILGSNYLYPNYPILKGFVQIKEKEEIIMSCANDDLKYNGLTQVTTFDYLNVVPQWNFCGITSNNWDEIEWRTRKLTRLVDKIVVWTGTEEILEHYMYNKQSIKVDLSDSQGNRINVPKYLWKVVNNAAVKSSVAIIQINIPFLTQQEAASHVRCKDICDQIEWLGDANWRDVNKGYTYCCGVIDFEEAFKYNNRFRDIHKVFRRIL